MCSNDASVQFPPLQLRVVLLMLAAAFSLAAACSAAEERKQPSDAAKIDAEALATLVQRFDKVEKEEHPWGWIRWLMSSKLDPKAEMTFGIVHINPGQRNPMHVHPNCEEQLYVLSGSCEHRVGEETVVLKAGDLLRIPAGVPHVARTFEKEPLRAVIVYSRGDRQFEVVEEVLLCDASEAQPLTSKPGELFINIDQQGRYFVTGELLTREQLDRVLNTAHINNPGRASVVIRADRRCDWKHVVSAVSACKKARIRNYRVTVR